MASRGGIAAITWAPSHRHSQDVAGMLNGQFYAIHYLTLNRPVLAPIKYVPQCLKTWWVLARQRPTAVYVFISPVFAALSVYVYCALTRTPMIMDVGTQALISRKWAWSVPLVRFLAKRVAVCIVDQTRFQRLLGSWGARTVLLERRPYVREWKRSAQYPMSRTCRITLISTFKPDEPIAEVINAARQLPDVEFRILGDSRLAPRDLISQAPHNVVFTGYLASDSYWDLLASSSAIMVLTSDEYSLTSGAIEGMALGKPLVLSRQPALVEYFTMGAVFVNNESNSIATGVTVARQREAELSREIRALLAEKSARYTREFERIATLLHEPL